MASKSTVSVGSSCNDGGRTKDNYKIQISPEKDSLDVKSVIRKRQEKEVVTLVLENCILRFLS